MDPYAEYAWLHLPEYESSVERYRLYLALSVYHLNQLHYAEALQFAKQACEGAEYIPQMDEKVFSMMKETICLLEDLFAEKITNSAHLDEIEQALKNIQELRSCHESDHE